MIALIETTSSKATDLLDFAPDSPDELAAWLDSLSDLRVQSVFAAALVERLVAGDLSAKVLAECLAVVRKRWRLGRVSTDPDAPDADPGSTDPAAPPTRLSIESLKTNQRELYDAMLAFLQQHGKPARPSDLSLLLGRSLSSVIYHVNRLVDLGFATRHGSRGRHRTFIPVPAP